MYIKWIVCDVKEDKKQEFTIAQNKWVKTADADGFIAQAGGWNLKNNSEACIISFWDNKASLENFMNDFHDTIFDKNKQADTYNSIDISHFIDSLSFEGRSDSLTNAIETGKTLKIIDCYLKQDKGVHFEEVQQEIWDPVIKKSVGLLGGIFSKASSNNFRYLISTFWDSIENHNNDVINMLPIYSKKAGLRDDITKIEGRAIKLVDSWKIIK